MSRTNKHRPVLDHAMMLGIFAVVVNAKMHPNSKGFKIEAREGVLHVWLTKPAENNMANAQLVKELSRALGSCRILRGAASKSKVLELPSDWKSHINPSSAD